MIIHQPLQISGPDGKGTGKWHMTERSDEENWPARPVGHCANGCPGHDTPEGANDHYDRWKADTAKELEEPDKQLRCEVCSTWTTHRMVPGGGWSAPIALCPAHSTPANVYVVLKLGDRR